MSSSLYEISLVDYGQLTLSTLFAAPLATPAFWQLSDSAIEISTSLKAMLLDANVAKKSNLVTNNSVNEFHDTEQTELVVFGDLNLTQLATICRECNLTISALSAINIRMGKTTFRFVISTPDINESRLSLNKLIQSFQQEMVIITNAPLLTRQGLLVMDMDSTTIEIECIDEIAKLAGVGNEVAEVTELAMQGKLDFSQSLKQRVAKLANAPESILASVIADLPLMSGLVELVAELKKHHWKIAIASGGFTYFANYLQEKLTLDDVEANHLEIINGKLTGNVLGRIVNAEVKAEVLTTLAEKYQISTQQTVAMGDGANDLVMMAAAHLGVAYKAKPIVLNKADTSINFSGLDCLIHWLK